MLFTQVLDKRHGTTSAPVSRLSLLEWSNPWNRGPSFESWQPVVYFAGRKSPEGIPRRGAHVLQIMPDSGFSFGRSIGATSGSPATSGGAANDSGNPGGPHLQSVAGSLQQR